MHEALVAKGARLSIAIADSCNNVVEVEEEYSATSTSPEVELRREVATMTMFADFRGHIIMKSSKEPFSFYRPDSEGYFTRQLFGVLLAPPWSDEAKLLWDKTLKAAAVPIAVPPHMQMPGESPMQTVQTAAYEATLSYEPAN